MKIKGLFGESHSVSEWADRLGVKPECVDLLLQAGKSIADIHRLLKKPYTPPKTRKPRESKKMVETKERMAILLEMSGVADRNEAIKDIVVERVGTHSYHRVAYQENLIGMYDYRKGSFQLCTGQGIPLWDLDWENVKIVQSSDGRWFVHPDTHKLLVQQAIKPDEGEAEDEEDADLIGVYKANQQAAEMRENSRQTHEGFGKRLNCKQWSNLLGVDYLSLWRALQRGESIEDFAERHGIKISRAPIIQDP